MSQDKRATRGLIALISRLPKSLLAEISPNAITLKKGIKFPMVLLCWSCGSLVSANIIFIKCFNEIWKAKELAEMPVLSSVCLVLGVTGCFMFIYTLNIAMRYYENIDVIPIF